MAYKNYLQTTVDLIKFDSTTFHKISEKSAFFSIREIMNLRLRVGCEIKTTRCIMVYVV